MGSVRAPRPCLEADLILDRCARRAYRTDSHRPHSGDGPRLHRGASGQASERARYRRIVAQAQAGEELSDDADEREPFRVAAVVRAGERRADRVEVAVRRLLTFSEARQLAELLIDTEDLNGMKA